MTIQQASEQLLFQLLKIYEEREANNIADLVMENVTGRQRTDRRLNKQVTLSAENEELLARYISELSAHKPVQYVLNEAWFYGMKLFVDENVLVPRPETEELVDWIYKDIQSVQTKLKALDVGTGSGCIALALKSKVPGLQVHACDISEPALTIARKNATSLQLTVDFIHCDFLDKDAQKKLPVLDILVSNPPYIPGSDKSSMHDNVLNYEPHLALFVEDDDPLIFYNAIVSFAKTNLAEAGVIYAEIHEEMGEKIKVLFIENGFVEVVLRNDFQDKKRMIKASRHTQHN